MTDRDALLAAVHAAPDDDAPRLIFADWLEENGHAERAEFIRIQIEMKRIHVACGYTRDLDALFLRQRSLFLQPWADVLRQAGASAIADYSRGWPTSGFQMAAARFSDLGPTLVEWYGVIARLHLRECEGELRTVAETPALAHVRHLQVGSPWGASDLTDGDVRRLAESPYLSELRALEILSSRGRMPRHRFVPLTAAFCDSLAAAGLTALELLNVSRNPVGDAGLAALIGGGSFPSLRELNLESTGLTDEGAHALLTASLPTSLTALNVTGNHFSDATVDRLEGRFGAILNPGVASERTAAE